jgi:uncharacterized protein YbaA (DUF1428 family)
MVNWPEWADKPTRDASMEKMIKDERIQGLMSCEKSWRLRAPDRRAMAAWSYAE